MQIGIDSFVSTVPAALTGQSISPADRLSNLLEEIYWLMRLGWILMASVSTTDRSSLTRLLRLSWRPLR